ncbi:hypothetical protein BsWGS_27723 [Bradybaena similaris]
MEKKEARAVIKFLMLQGKTPREIHTEMKPVFLESCPAITSVKYWCQHFKCGRSSVADLPRSGRPPSKCNEENAIKVKKIIDEDRKMTVVEIASRVQLNERTVYRILHHRLKMRRLCERWVPATLDYDNDCNT